jgi:hypothetical protein
MISNHEGMIKNENEISKMGCNQERIIINENTPKEDMKTRSG